MQNLSQFIENQKSLSEIQTFFNGLSFEKKLAELNAFPGKQMVKFFKLAQKMQVSDFIEPNYPVLKPVNFWGKNSAPAFNYFQKPMCRLDNKTICGYNNQTFKWLVGPGYFMLDDTTKRDGEPMFDYTRVPQTKPEAWPEIKPNDRWFSNFLFKGMQDFMRLIAPGFFIGEATKKDKSMGQYFLLLKEETQTSPQNSYA